MIIYTDSEINLEEMFGTRELTPAHLHLQTKDFSVILDDLVSGNIPTGTGKPFNVNWKPEEDTDSSSPWINNTVYQKEPSTGFINPYR